MTIWILNELPNTFHSRDGSFKVKFSFSFKLFSYDYRK